MSNFIIIKPLKAELKKGNNINMDTYVVLKFGASEWKSSICEGSGIKP